MIFKTATSEIQLVAVFIQWKSFSIFPKHAVYISAKNTKKKSQTLHTNDTKTNPMGPSLDVTLRCDIFMLINFSRNNYG